MIYDVIIVGGGPAGISAGIYSARKHLKTLFLAFEIGGQSTVSPTIENWIGLPTISGAELGQKLKAHLESYKGEWLDIKERMKVTEIKKDGEIFFVIDDKGITYQSQTVLITTGSRRRKLSAPGSEQFEHKGISYCASCDAPLYSGSDTVAVIGGGNAGFGTASQLTAYAKKVYIIEQMPNFRAETITVEKLLKNPQVTALSNTEILEIKGEKFVSSLVYKDLQMGKITELPVQGVFVEIGNIPETAFAKGLVEMNPMGGIIIDPRQQTTSQKGIWAAGDCTDILYHQNNISAGDGVVAIEDIYNYLLKK